jgi:heme-degrading monooxygenase HmoA
MWAQMITVRVKEGAEGEIARVMEMLRGVEQPDSGLLRHLVFRDQADPLLIRTVVVFESEEKARLREADIRRHEVQAAAQAVLAEAIAGPPEFANLDVIWESSY